MVELKKQLLSIFLPRAINTTIVENLKKIKGTIVMFAGCSVLFPVARNRSALGSLYRGKPFAKDLM